MHAGSMDWEKYAYLWAASCVTSRHQSRVHTIPASFVWRHIMIMLTMLSSRWFPQSRQNQVEWAPRYPILQTHEPVLCTVWTEDGKFSCIAGGWLQCWFVHTRHSLLTASSAWKNHISPTKATLACFSVEICVPRIQNWRSINWNSCMGLTCRPVLGLLNSWWYSVEHTECSPTKESILCRLSFHTEDKSHISFLFGPTQRLNTPQPCMYGREFDWAVQQLLREQILRLAAGRAPFLLAYMCMASPTPASIAHPDTCNQAPRKSPTVKRSRSNIPW